MMQLNAPTVAAIDPWIPLWISVGAAAAAGLGLVFFAWQAVSAHRTRPDKGTVRLQLVGSDGHRKLWDDEWVLQNAGTGTAINPRVEFNVPASWLTNTKLTASAAGLVGPLGSLRLAPKNNWPSPGTTSTEGGMLWEGLVGTAYWRVPGRKGERSREIEVFVDPTPPEMASHRRS